MTTVDLAAAVLRRLFRRRRDPWTDPTLPPRCAETHPQWGTQCVKESSEHAEHCDYLGAQWYGGWCRHD